MQGKDPKKNLLEHSEAKVELYGRYLSIYLNILHWVGRIFIFDLFCGEGIYENGAKGSPTIALDCIRNHYFSYQSTIPNTTVWFNDIGKSELENGFKVEHVEKISKTTFVPPNASLKFFKEDYRIIFPKAIQEVSQTKDAKGLFFIDPFGYKVIKPNDIRQMLEIGNTEVLLWLPIAQMYRFAGSVMENNFPGSDPLRSFLTELFGNSNPQFRSPYDFIEQLKEKFRTYLEDLGIYVDTFTLERDATNVYALFFFTSNIKGFEKMVETKWRLDRDRGKGFTREKTLTFFSEIELSGYPHKLKNFLENAEYRTNEELYRFGLMNGFLPKHTKSVLDAFKKDGLTDVISLDGKPTKGYYLGDLSRKVGISLKSKNL